MPNSMGAIAATAARGHREGPVRVGVIGAGVSGLTAAHTLHDAGVDVRVFEKSRGLGGRTSRRREGDCSFDHGASSFAVKDHRFRRRVDAWLAMGVVREWTPRLGTAVHGRISPVESVEARYVGVPGMNAMTHDLSSKLDVRRSRRVLGLERRDAGWMLRLENEELDGPFDRVVVSLPAPQARPLLDHSPTLAAQMDAIHIVPTWAIMLALPEPLGLGFDAVHVHDGPLAWIARDASKPGRAPAPDTWVLHASHDWSRTHIEDDPDRVADALLDAFSSLAGRPLRPMLLRAHRWRHALPTELHPANCLFDAQTGLAACGDCCGGPRIEGAYLSGLAIADRLLVNTTAA